MAWVMWMVYYASSCKLAHIHNKNDGYGYVLDQPISALHITWVGLMIDRASLRTYCCCLAHP